MKPESGSVMVKGSSGLTSGAVVRRFTGRFEYALGFDRKAPKPPLGFVYTGRNHVG